jgi:glycosyltransferase involved in cell wall biosynthesis
MVNLHGLEMFQPSYSWRERLGKQLMKGVFRRQMRKAWRVVSLGGQLTDILVEQGAIRENIVVIPNAIESKWILTREEIEAKMAKRSADSIKFVMVGRNEYRKGLHILQEAMLRLEQPIELHMIGDWPYWDAGIHCVVHHGVIRDKQKLMATLDECDVLLLPSLSEGMPTVVLEAMARGLKVIGTDVGAMSELQEELISHGNTRCLTDVIRLCKKNRSCMSLNARYKWEMITQSTVKTLQR